jgi:hypothetical protein
MLVVITTISCHVFGFAFFYFRLPWIFEVSPESQWTAHLWQVGTCNQIIPCRLYYHPWYVPDCGLRLLVWLRHLARGVGIFEAELPEM